MNKGSTIVTVLRVTRQTVGGNSNFNKGYSIQPIFAKVWNIFFVMFKLQIFVIILRQTKAFVSK